MFDFWSWIFSVLLVCKFRLGPSFSVSGPQSVAFQRSANLFRKSFRCADPSQLDRKHRNGPKCRDRERHCHKFRDELFDIDGRCMSPLNELCMETCGLCSDVTEYASCRSPIDMDLAHIPSDTAIGIGPRTIHPGLMKPGGPRHLFEGMAKRLNITLKAQRPLLLEVDGFLDLREVEKLVKLIDQVVVPEDDLPPRVRNVSKMDCEELSCMTNPTVVAAYRKVEQLVLLPAGNFESLEFLRYSPGHHYSQHQDSGAAEQFHPGGPRYLTAFVYLSEQPQDGGGATLFPMANLRIEPRPGKLVIWSNVKESRPWEDEDWAEHAAERVRYGTKYAFNLWIHPRNVRLVSLADGVHRCMPDLA